MHTKANLFPFSSHALGILTPKSHSSWNFSFVSNGTRTIAVHFVHYELLHKCHDQRCGLGWSGNAN